MTSAFLKLSTNFLVLTGSFHFTVHVSSCNFLSRFHNIKLHYISLKKMLCKCKSKMIKIPQKWCWKWIFRNWISTKLFWILWLARMFVESRDFRCTGFPADFRTKAWLCILEVLGFAQRGRIVPTGVFLFIWQKITTIILFKYRFISLCMSAHVIFWADLIISICIT